MKNSLFIIFSIFTFAACDIYVVEEEVYYDERDQFTGNYEIEEYSETLDAFSYYNIYITKSRSDLYTIYLDNFYGANFEVFADVQGNKLSIPLQKIGYYEIEGYGSVYNGELKMSYTVKDVSHHRRLTDYCVATGWLY